MITLGILSGIGALALGLAIADRFGKRRPSRRLDVSIDSAESRTFTGGSLMNRPGASEYFPPPDDGRPR